MGNAINARNVADIIDLEYLQRIQDSLGLLTNITTAVLDTNGVPVTRPTNLFSFCQMMQSSAEGVRMCIQANQQLLEINRTTRGNAVLSCPNSMLKTASVPIFLGDEFLGSWLIGQLRTDEIDLQLIERTALRAGLSVEDAKKNISMLPIITQSEFEDILEVLTTITRVITEQAQINNALYIKNEELTRLTKQLDNSARVFKEFIDLSVIGVYLLDFYTGELIMCNNMYANMVGANSGDELMGRKCFQALGKEDWCSFCPRDKLLDENGVPVAPYEWDNYLPDMDIWLHITSRAIKWLDERLALFVVFTDNTESMKRAEHMEYIAYYDQRMGIPNAVKLLKDINEHTGEGTYLLCFDIQGLRKTNDVYSREAGDMLLHSIRDWLIAPEGMNLNMYRVEGDEFGVLLQGALPEYVRSLTDQIWMRFASPWLFTLDDVPQKIFTRISMGIIPCRQQGFHEHSHMLNTIARTLDAARTHNRPMHYDASVDKAFHDHLQLEMSLKECVLNGMQGFYLCYQPIVNPYTGRWVGLEALCRWVRPGFGLVSPMVFIPEAEQLGLIGMLGEWVMREAIRQVKHWKLDQCEGFMIDINLSPLQLSDEDICAQVAKVLVEYDFPPQKLSLEITESVEVQFNEQLLPTLSKLRELGVSLSLDDFGTGYATFSNLRELPVSIIKTDRSFVTHIEEDETMRLTYRIMADFAHVTGKLLVAEGVETQAQCNILLEYGVDYIQGFLFSQPLRAEEMEKQLDRVGMV